MRKVEKDLRRLVVRNGDLYTMFVDAIGCGPLDGGCWVMAKALKKVYGGTIMTLCGDHGDGQVRPQHLVVRLGSDVYLDADGVSTWYELSLRWQLYELMRVVGLREFRPTDLACSPRNHELVNRVVEHLGKGKKCQSASVSGTAR